MNSCGICQKILLDVYIECAECNSTLPNKICLKCFASGADYSKHSSAHSYTISSNYEKIFPMSKWSAIQDIDLLDLIEHNGFGNWDKISSKFRRSNNQECKNHFIESFFNKIFWGTSDLSHIDFHPISVPYLFHDNTFDPPRHQLDLMQKNETSSYRFARSDFDTPFDCYSENLIANLDFEADMDEEFKAIFETLNYSLVVAYNNRIR